MGAEAFVVWNNQTFLAPQGVVPGDEVTLATSPQISNGPTARSSLSVTLEYKSITPNITAGSPPFPLGAVIEQQDANSAWQPIAYQFSPYRNTESPGKRTIILQPDLSALDAGIDDSVFPVSREIARISRQQGRLRDADFRIRLILVDFDPTGPNAFQSVVVSCAGERYDHV